MHRDKDTVTIEGTGENESHFFKGSVAEGGEAECVLLFNPETNKFELRVLDYALRVTPASKDSKKGFEAEEVTPAPAEPVYTKPEDTMAQKFEAQDNKGSSYIKGKNGRTSKSRPSVAPVSSASRVPKNSAPRERIEVSIPLADETAKSKSSVGSNHVQDEDDDDDEDDAQLLGELENELEMLSDDNTAKGRDENKEDDDDDDDEGNSGGMSIQIVDRSKSGSGISSNSKSFYQNSPPKPGGGTGPISLRGFISGAARRENEEDLLSSSEEE